MAEAQQSFGQPPRSRSRNLEGQELEDALDCKLLLPYLMLVGCAFENALKGILVGRHPELVTEDGQITGKLKNHVLLQLFRDCGFSPSTEDVATLETLAQHVVWRGRYP